MLLTHTNNWENLFCSASRNNLEECPHWREGSSHTLGRYARNLCCAKVTLAFYSIKLLALICIQNRHFLDYVFSGLLSKICFLLKMCWQLFSFFSSTLLTLTSESGPAHPCCSQPHSGSLSLACPCDGGESLVKLFSAFFSTKNSSVILAQCYHWSAACPCSTEQQTLLAQPLTDKLVSLLRLRALLLSQVSVREVI